MVFDTVLTGNQPNLTEEYMENYRKINWASSSEATSFFEKLKVNDS